MTRLAIVLLTALGPFVCDSTVCRDTPDPAYAGYWRPDGNPRLWPPATEGSLLITVDHRPFAVLRCEQIGKPKDDHLWWCE